MKIIEINNLTKYYKNVKGIENVSFTVDEGEICGFIGPNGAGKSTTIRTLLALIRPTAGSASIFGMDCVTESSKIAASVGYLPGESFYYEQLTVKQLLDYSEALYGVDCHERRNELVERLQLDVTRKISQLSLGNRKKVGIVSALMHSPKLLILDEPTSGLDPLIQQTLFDILHEENKKGVTILFSSHVLSEVQKLCHRVIIIKSGNIIAEQSIDELKKNGYKKVNLITKKPVSNDTFSDMMNVSINECTVNFLFKGKITELLSRIQKQDLIDATIEEPSLEEVFLHYYQ